MTASADNFLSTAQVAAVVARLGRRVWEIDEEKLREELLKLKPGVVSRGDAQAAIEHAIQYGGLRRDGTRILITENQL